MEADYARPPVHIDRSVMMVTALSPVICTSQVTSTGSAS